MPSVYLNIGSNRGDRRATIQRAVEMISNHFGGAVVRVSQYVRSLPWGYDSESEFLNVGVAIDWADATAMPTADEILDYTQSVERDIAPGDSHRNADGTYRDRIIDIDIIDIDGVKMETERLTIPHPRAAARRFVMEPMQFLCPGWQPESKSRIHRKKTASEMHRAEATAYLASEKLPLALIVDNVRSLNNIGSMFRTADAFGVRLIALCGISAQPPHPDIHKTALGAEETVMWKHYDTTTDAVEALRGEGWTICALEQVHRSVSLDTYRPENGEKTAIVVGNEVLGVEQKVVDMCDVCLEIPQCGSKHSLNVAVSAAVALWHLFSAINRPSNDDNTDN